MSTPHGRDFLGVGGDLSNRRALLLLLLNGTVEAAKLSADEDAVWEMIIMGRRNIAAAAIELGIPRMTCNDRFKAAVHKVRTVLKNDPAMQFFATVLKDLMDD